MRIRENIDGQERVVGEREIGNLRGNPDNDCGLIIGEGVATHN